MRTKNNQEEVAVEFRGYEIGDYEAEDREAEGYYLVKFVHSFVDMGKVPSAKFIFRTMKNGISLENKNEIKNTKGIFKAQFLCLTNSGNLKYLISELKALETYGLPIIDYTKISSNQLFEIITCLEDFKDLNFGIKVKNSEKDPSRQIITIIPKEEAIKVGLIIK